MKSFISLIDKDKAPFTLAPLAGFTNSSFRLLCVRQGAALSCSEMISAKGLYYKSRRTEELLAIRPEEGPVGYQIFGSDIDAFEFSAKFLEQRPNAFLDINMGCPVPKVVKNKEGSALIKNAPLAAELVKVLKRTTNKPVTVKFRIGFAEDPSKDDFDIVEFAQTLEDAGADAIAVHGRTREQYYSGKADWQMIKRIKDAVKIPVIGNGDVFTADDGMRMLDETGVDLVMVGRGALGNPWIFRELTAKYKGQQAPERPSIEEIITSIKDQIEMDISLKGNYGTVIEMRKHVSFYTKGIKGAAELRRDINTAETIEELYERVDGLRKYNY